MAHRGWSLVAQLALGLLGVGVTLAEPAAARAGDIDRMYHYPFYYYPHMYWPAQQQWPDRRKPFQPPPKYMAYPPYLDTNFHYELWRPHRYYKGFHFWLDQF